MTEVNTSKKRVQRTRFAKWERLLWRHGWLAFTWQLVLRAQRKAGREMELHDNPTHHDFRHYFATVCIESGADIPTVSRWLGHADGGALAMKTYGHLRQEHSLAQAAKVAI